MSDYMHSFELFEPASVADAAKLASKFGKDGWIIAGGKDSLDWFKDRHKRPKAVINIANLKELRGIKDHKNYVSIGSVTTLTEMENSKLLNKHFPVLIDAVSRVASPQIRNAGTIGGNIAQDTRCSYYRDGFPSR